MNPSVLASILVKAVAIYLIAQGVMHVPEIVTVFQYSSDNIDNRTIYYTVSFFAIFTPMLVGLFLWFISGKVCELMLNGVVQNEQPKIEPDSIYSIAITIIGIALLVFSIPQFVTLIIQLFGNMNEVNGENQFNIYTLSSVIGAFIKLVLGLSLILGVGGWVRVINKLRVLGTK